MCYSRFVTEIIACSNVEMEPYYECSICNMQGEANGMFNHIFGKGHRENFLRKVRPDQDFGGNIRSKIEQLKENGAEARLIRTIYSDELYPWSSGKAPWSIEQGGTGIAPTNARNSLTIKSEISQANGQTKAKQTTPAVFNISSSDIKNFKDLKAGYEAARMVIDDVSKFLEDNLEHPEDQVKVSMYKSLLKTNLDLLSDLAEERN